MEMHQGKQTFNINEIAAMAGVTKQAVYLAVRKKALKGIQMPGNHQWRISVDDYENYKRNKYSRTLKKDDQGKLIFDPKEGRYSLPMLAKELGVPAQRVYYLIRVGVIKSEKCGGAYIIHVKDIEKLKNYFPKKKVAVI